MKFLSLATTSFYKRPLEIFFIPATNPAKLAFPTSIMCVPSGSLKRTQTLCHHNPGICKCPPDLPKAVFAARPPRKTCTWSTCCSSCDRLRLRLQLRELIRTHGQTNLQDTSPSQRDARKTRPMSYRLYNSMSFNPDTCIPLFVTPLHCHILISLQRMSVDTPLQFLNLSTVLKTFSISIFLSQTVHISNPSPTHIDSAPRDSPRLVVRVFHASCGMTNPFVLISAKCVFPRMQAVR